MVMQDILYHDPRISKQAKRLISLTDSKKNGINIGGSLRNRASPIDSFPIEMEPSRFPMPPMPSKTLAFDQVMDCAIQDLIRNNQGKTIYVAWSGGIDSTSIVAGFLRNCENLRNIKILCSEISRFENPRFYDRFVCPNFQVLSSNEFQILPHMLEDSIVVDGNCGNQIFGNGWISRSVIRGRTEILDRDWREIDFPSYIGKGANLDLVEYIKATVSDSPVPIETVFDFSWWGWFNLKFEHVLYAPTMMFYDASPALADTDLKRLFLDVFYRPYATVLMQQWALSNLPERREKERITVKWHAKDYIRSVDGDPYYFMNKTVTESNNKIIGSTPCFAIDSDWNCLRLSDASTRRMLMDLLSDQD